MNQRKRKNSIALFFKKNKLFHFGEVFFVLEKFLIFLVSLKRNITYNL